MGKKPAVIFDMDGTLCDVRSIRQYVLDQRRRDYDAFHYLSLFCPPHEWVRDLAQKHHADGTTVLVVTARQEQWRAITESWMLHHEVPYHSLHMRKQGDKRKDKIIKGEILDLLLELYDIEHAVDDNPSIIELWQERGIPYTVVPGWCYE